MRRSARTRTVGLARKVADAHATVNPANIRRVGRELPPGYEVTTGIPSGASPG